MEIDLNDDEIIFIKRVCERVLLFAEMGIRTETFYQEDVCATLLKKLEVKSEN